MGFAPSFAFAKRRRTPSFSFAKRRRLASFAFVKRRRTSPCSRSRGQLLYVACLRMCGSSHPAFDIYSVDITSTGDSVGDAISPTLIVDDKRFNFQTVCVLGSKLYMFQSSHNSEWVGDGTSVGTVKLSKYLTRKNVKLEDNMIKYINSMSYPKRFPVATPTPGGKILVFSTHIRINPDDGDETANPIDFELYDPATKEWKQLPRIYDNWDEGRKRSCFYSISIGSFAFMSESILLIITQNGMFELELESSGGWQDWATHARKVPQPCGASFLVTEGGLCFSPYFAFDINTPKASSLCSYFPRRAFDRSDGYKLHATSGIIESLDDDGDCNFCIVETVINEDTGYPHLAIYVYHCDLAKYREDKRILIANFREDMRNLKAKYRENRRNLKANNYNGEDNHKTATKRLKQEYEWDKTALKSGNISQLSIRLDKSFKFVLDTQRTGWFAPLSLSFVSPRTRTA